VLEAPDKWLSCPITFILVIDTAKVYNDEVARLVDDRRQEERKIHEEEWKRQEDEWERREDDFRSSFKFEMEKMKRDFKRYTNQPSYPPPHHTLHRDNGSSSNLKDLSAIPEVILSNICAHIYLYTHICTYTYIHLHTYTCLFVILIILLS